MHNIEKCLRTIEWRVQDNFTKTISLSKVTVGNGNFKIVFDDDSLKNYVS